MPALTFDKEYLAKGFVWLARRGEVVCLPDDIFIIGPELYRKLKKSNIPHRLLNRHERPSHGVIHAKKTKSEKNKKVQV